MYINTHTLEKKNSCCNLEITKMLFFHFSPYYYSTYLCQIFKFGFKMI